MGKYYFEVIRHGELFGLVTECKFQPKIRVASMDCLYCCHNRTPREHLPSALDNILYDRKNYTLCERIVPKKEIKV